MKLVPMLSLEREPLARHIASKERSNDSWLTGRALDMILGIPLPDEAPARQ